MVWTSFPCGVVHLTALILHPEQKKDKEFVQKVKGTKLLEVTLLSYIGKGRTPDSVYTAVEKQAEKRVGQTTKLV